jgi:hypothetical protein
MTTLIDRLRAAKGPDRDLDAEIYAAVHGGFPAHLCHDWTRRAYSAGYVHGDDDGSNLTSWGKSAPEYTASLDAAMTLVQPGYFAKLSFGRMVDQKGREFCHAVLEADADSLGRDMREDEPYEHEAINAHTPAIALTIAALLARGIS